MSKLLHWVLLLLCSLNVTAQETLKQSFDSIRQLDYRVVEKIKLTNNLLSETDTLYKTKELGYVYHKLGLLYRSEGDYSRAITETLKAVDIRESLPTKDTTALNNSLYNIYIYHRKLHKKLEGKKYLDLIIKNNSTDKFNYKALIELALLSSAEGDYFKALSYLEPAIVSFDVYQDILTYRKAHLACIHVYSNMDFKAENLPAITMHRKKVEELSAPAQDLGDMYLNLSTIFFHDKDQSLRYLNKAIPVYKKLTDTTKLGTFYNNLAVNYSELGLSEKANQYYEKALAISNNVTTTADVYNNQGFYLASGVPEEKITYYYKSLHTILYGTETPLEPEMDYLIKIESSPFKTDILHHLSDIAKEWVRAYEVNLSHAHLQKALETLRLVDQVISLIRLDSSLEKSKLFWIHKGVDSYALAVKVCFLLNDVESGFYFMEKNKSLLLLENLDNLKAQLALDIPKEVLDREKSFGVKKLLLKNQIDRQPNNEELQRDFTQTNNEHAIFIDSLKVQFPSYFNVKRDPKISALSNAIAKHVSSNTSWVEYIITPTEGYGIYCSKAETIFFTMEDIPTFLKDVASLKERIKAPFLNKTEFESYSVLSNRVYQQLFPFSEAIDKLKSKKLIVIPDFTIMNLPFSALVATQEGSTYQPDYMLHHTEVSYLHSISVFDQINTSKHDQHKMVGFAPVNFEKDGLPNLTASEEEMNTYASILPMDLKLREAATRQTFQQSLKEYSVIHLSTHAGYEISETPWISLHNEKLTLDDIYQMETSTHLVVLDACKSALGNLEVGEGVNSLSRAFFYNGTQSVIASQWNANEQANNQIFNAFYKNIKNKETKSKALQNAKIAYLKSNQLDRLSPYFWAPLTITGNTDIVLLDESRQTLWWLGGILLILLFLLILKKKHSL